MLPYGKVVRAMLRPATLVLMGLASAAAIAHAFWAPFPASGGNPVLDLIAYHDPGFHTVIRVWYYVAPAVAVLLFGSLGLSVWRVWLQPRAGGGRRGTLPPWPASPEDETPSLVIGELHRFEAGAAGSEAPVSIRDLVRHALRHRPDHIVVGEVRGGEAADLLQALNTGHGGSLTTVHANNARSALSRLASCAMQAGGALPWEVTCRGVVDGISLVLHMARQRGRRFVEEALRVRGYDSAANRWLTDTVWRKHDQSTTEVSREDERQTKE